MAFLRTQKPSKIPITYYQASKVQENTAGRGRGPLWVFPTWNMEHGGILSMPDLTFILIFDQNDVFDHFLIFTPFLRLIFAIY